MGFHDPIDSAPWHSLERAWVPLIRLMTISLTMILFAPLLRLVVPQL